MNWIATTICLLFTGLGVWFLWGCYMLQRDREGERRRIVPTADPLQLIEEPPKRLHAL
jgi:hypothetical protein